MRTQKKGIFVTGTGTGVGKTLISGAIVRALVNKGYDCGVMKPIESGCDVGKRGLQPRDALYLQQAAKLQDEIELINPCRFQAPVAPYAAVLQGEPDVSWPLIEDCHRQLSERHEAILIEGAGGLMVPIRADKDMSELAHLFGFPVLLVAQSGLGTINHVLLSLEYGKMRGLSFLGIVLNQSTEQKDSSEASNIKIIREKTDLPVMSFPYIKSKNDDATVISESAALLEGHPLMGVILTLLSLRSSG
ncbi:Dethiobiotin synthetase [hydrothermal vent metagenome]|uniref:Dethiobiotin synthetase n=1 Tax=hydrothermal vent metagenome TaxID=652676 RepID=A0A3B1CMA2_9ZZZZ